LVFYGGFVWARRALNSQKRRFPARAVVPALTAEGFKVISPSPHPRPCPTVHGVQDAAGRQVVPLDPSLAAALEEYVADTLAAAGGDPRGMGQVMAASVVQRATSILRRC
jgi:hypothetical protein